MSTQPEALRLAGALIERHGVESFEGEAAAELRRLSAENKRFAALVCDYAAEEAPDAIRKIAVDRDRWHTKAQQAEAQRDALLEVLKKAEENGCATVYANEDDECGERGCCGVVSYKPHADDCWVITARAAIKAVEGDKEARWQALAQEAQKHFDEGLKKFEGEKE